MLFFTNTFLFLCSFVTITALPACPQNFEKKINIENWSKGLGMIQTPDKGYIISGIYSTDPTGQTQKLFLTKLDTWGNVLWMKESTFGISVNGFKMTTGLTNTHNGGFAIAVALDPVERTGQLLATFDSLGNNIWSIIHSSDLSYAGISLIETKDHGFVMEYGESTIGSGISKFDSSGNLKWSHFFTYTCLSNRFYTYENTDGSIIIGPELTAKFSSSGELIWAHLDSSSQFTQRFGMTKTAEGGFAISGLTSPLSSANTYVIKYNQNGEKVFENNINMLESSFGNAITGLPDSSLVITGLCGGSVASIFLLKLSNTGEVQSLKKLRLDNANADGLSIITANENELALTGSIGAGLPEFGISQDSVLVLKLSSDLSACNLIPSLYTAEPIATTVRIFNQMSDPVFASQATSVHNFFSSTNITTFDECSESNVILPPSNSSFSVSPNPLSEGSSVLVKINNLILKTYSLVILDLLGNILKQESINLTSKHQEIPLDVSRCTSGVYFIEVKNDEGVIAREKFVKE